MAKRKLLKTHLFLLTVFLLISITLASTFVNSVSANQKRRVYSEKAYLPLSIQVKVGWENQAGDFNKRYNATPGVRYSVLYKFDPSDPYVLTPTYGYKQAFATGVAQWNAVATGVAYTPNSNGPTVFKTFVNPDTDLGGVTQTVHDGNTYALLYTIVSLNRTALTNKSQSFKLAVTIHELGHGFGLGHVEIPRSLPTLSIMNPIMETPFIVPQSQDRKLINERAYPRFTPTP